MGMHKRSHVTNGVQALALDLASTMPYRRSADILQKTTAIEMTHQTIWRLVAKAADPYLQKVEQERKWFQTTREIPTSDGTQIDRLMAQAGAGQEFEAPETVKPIFIEHELQE